MSSTTTILVNFIGSDGSIPKSTLTLDAAGDLFGTTWEGGYGLPPYYNGEGTVFEIDKTASGYASVPTNPFIFDSTDGYGPLGSLVVDGNGGIFGTAAASDASGNGLLFELVNDGGSSYTQTTLVPANLSDPVKNVGVTADAAGDLFGSTVSTVFEIVRSDGGYASTPTTLARVGSNSSLAMDAAGDLFGTTYSTAFEIPKTSSGYGSVTTLAIFPNGGAPDLGAGLVVDAAGDLFGTTGRGGTDSDGTVFEIPKTPGGYGLLVTLASFDGTDGEYADAGLIVDAAGNLFGTTEQGGPNEDEGPPGGAGTVFEIEKTDGSYANTPTTVVDFNLNTDAASGPLGGLIADAAGDLFGTTYTGGTGDGTVFEITNSGFVPAVACFVGGTRICTATGDVPVEDLRVGIEVRLAHGGKRPVVWIGRRQIDFRRHPRPTAVWPVRVRPDAFGCGRPLRNLWLSPDHAVFLDGVLIPIRCLVNDTTIAQERPDNITYWHVELPQHDVLLAEGLPAESYLDTGNRCAFDNAAGPIMLHPDFAKHVWDAKACAELILGGPHLILTKRRVQIQASLLGYTCMNDPKSANPRAGLRTAAQNQ